MKIADEDAICNLTAHKFIAASLCLQMDVTEASDEALRNFLVTT